MCVGFLSEKSSVNRTVQWKSQEHRTYKSDLSQKHVIHKMLKCAPCRDGRRRQAGGVLDLGLVSMNSVEQSHAK